MFGCSRAGAWQIYQYGKFSLETPLKYYFGDNSKANLKK
jgi:hypothetical protein